MATYYWTKAQRAIPNIVYMDPIAGFDTNDGSINSPKKTFAGVGTSKPVALPTCDINNQTSSAGLIIYGTGNTKLIGCTIGATGDKYDINVIKCTISVSSNSLWTRCYIDGGGDAMLTRLSFCFVNDVIKLTNGSAYNDIHGNCIFANSIIDYINTHSLPANNSIQNNIYYNCSIRLGGTAYPSVINFAYNIIAPNCLIAIGAGDFKSIATIESETGLTGMGAIEAAYKAVYPTGYLNSNNNKVLDPLFVDATNGNYSVFSNSQAIGTGNGGVNIGNVNIGRKINIVSDSKQTYDAMDTESSINAAFSENQVSSDSINDLTIYSQIIEFPDVIQFKGAKLNFLDSQSNNELLDDMLPYDLSSPISAGTALEDTCLYIVKVDSVTYASVVRAVDVIFKASGTGSFTGSGVVHKITELPNYKTYGVRWINTCDVELSAGNTLDVGSEYIVAYNPITYNGFERPVGSSFRCKEGITVFTGTGKVKCIFTSSDLFKDFLINKLPVFKTVGNVETGSIDITNGQKEYHDSSNDSRPDFYVKGKYFQIRLETRTKSLK